MSKIYAVIGTNSMTVVADSVRYNPQTNEVLMQSERPSEGNYIANENGEWVEDKAKKLAALDVQYNSDKAELLAQYTDAIIHNDTETAEAIKEEMQTLDSQYDEDYRSIIEEE